MAGRNGRLKYAGAMNAAADDNDIVVFQCLLAAALFFELQDGSTRRHLDLAIDDGAFRDRDRACADASANHGGVADLQFVLDLEAADGAASFLFLRYDRSDPARTKDPWTLHREATVYLALQDSAVPVPRVLGVHPVHQAMVSERVQGGNWFSRIVDPVEQEATARRRRKK